MIEALVETIEGFNPPLHHGTANSLLAKLNTALAELEAGDTAEARALIGAFINQVQAQAGKKISQAQAAELRAAAFATTPLRGERLRRSLVSSMTAHKS